MYIDMLLCKLSILFSIYFLVVIFHHAYYLAFNLFIILCVSRPF